MNFAWSDLNRAAQGTIICAILGFFVQVRTLSVEGTSCTFTDYAALVFGAMTLVAAGLALRAAMSTPEVDADFRPDSVRLVAIGGLVVAAIHLLRGLGILFSPC